MPCGNRRSYRALGRCLGVALLVWANGVSAAEPVGKQIAPAQTQQPETKQPEPTPPPLPVPSQQQQPAPYDYQRPCENADNQEKSDLCQQWRMAQAAEELSGLTAIQTNLINRQFWATVVEVGLLLGTVVATVLAAVAASTAANAARDAVALERAWITYTALVTDFVGNLIEDGKPRGRAMSVRAELVNCGRTPARQVECYSDHKVVPATDHAIPHFAADWQSEHFDVIAASAPYRAGIGFVYGAEMEAVLNGQSRIYLYVACRYRDIFHPGVARTLEACIDITCAGFMVDHQGRSVPDLRHQARQNTVT